MLPLRKQKPSNKADFYHPLRILHPRRQDLGTSKPRAEALLRGGSSLHNTKCRLGVPWAPGTSGDVAETLGCFPVCSCKAATHASLGSEHTSERGPLS